MKQFGEDLNDEQVNEMVEQADIDMDGLISYEGNCLLVFITCKCWYSCVMCLGFLLENEHTLNRRRKLSFFIHNISKC